MTKLITRDELKNKIEHHDRFYLVEALGPEFFERSHLPGAINMPPDEISNLASKYLPDKHAEVVTYCMRST